MSDDDYGTVTERSPRSGLYRRRDRFVLPGWAWPILGVVCLLLGMALGWLLWRPSPGAKPTPSLTATALAEVATATLAPATSTATKPLTATPGPPDTATHTATAAPTNTPVLTATPTTVATIVVGGRVKVSGTGGTNLRLRSGPGLDFITFKIIEEGSILEVLEGPQKAGGHNWWRLKDDKGVIGWAADDWLVPVP